MKRVKSYSLHVAGAAAAGIHTLKVLRLAAVTLANPMHILALETSGSAGSIAAAEGPRLIREQALNPHERSARSLTPAIRALLDAVGWKVTQVGLIAVTIGPGSFTGLRVGVATAKTLAYVLNARCVGVNTLAVIAAQATGDYPRVSVAMDAQRGQVFCALFEPPIADDSSETDSPPPSGETMAAAGATGDGLPRAWQLIGNPTVLDNAKWRSSLTRGMAVSGPALFKLAESVPAGVTVIAQQEWMPRAATVAALAWQRHLHGAYDDIWRLRPLYMRQSAAEEKWDARIEDRGLRIEG